LAKYQVKMTEWDIMLSVARYFDVLALINRFESGPVTTDLTTAVVRSYKSLINDVKPDHSLIH